MLVVFSRRAKKYLARIPHQDAQRIFTIALGLGTNPYPRGVVRVVSKEHVYRVRVGQYRILYTITDEVTIDRIDKRSRAYR